MTNEKNKNDVFLSAVRGTTPIKKTNKNYKIVKQIKTPRGKKDKTISKAVLDDLEDYNKHAIKKNYKYLKTEKSNINKKLKKGLINIDKKIDLHGLTVEEARSIFFETINECFFAKKRCILFITGKGMGKRRAPNQQERLYYGKIRSEFIKWTSERGVEQKILNTEQAGISHGGAGAFFVYLRKNKH